MTKISALPIVAAPDGNEQAVVLKDGIAKRASLSALILGAITPILTAATSLATKKLGVIDPSYELSQIGWDTARFPIGSLTIESLGDRLRCSAGIDVESMWKTVAGDYTGWPTYWVRQDGSNSNSGTSEAQAFYTIEKAIQVANAAGVPARIMVKTGYYNRYQNFCGSGGNTQPSVPLVFMAYAGRVVCAAAEVGSNLTWTADGTYNWIYSASRSGALRIVNLLGRDRFGHYDELVKLGSAAAVSRTPGSWALVGSTVYVNRADGAQPNDTNTRVFMTIPNFIHGYQTQKSFLFTGQADGDGFDFEGGLVAGDTTGGCICLAYNNAAQVPVNKVMVAAKNCTFRYAGGSGTTTEGNNIRILALHGLAAFQGCDASKAAADGFNLHNQSGGSAIGAYPALLTINCTGFDNGRGQSISNNGWTMHEDCRGVDICGYYSHNRGSTMHIIGTTMAALFGSTSERSLGDIMNGGSTVPCEFRTENTAKMFVRLSNARPGSRANDAARADNSSVIAYRDCVVDGQLRTFGAGSITVY